MGCCRYWVLIPFAELDSTKNINNLFSNTTYEWQMKAWGMNGCIDGWSDSEFFTTLCVDGVDVDSVPISCHNGSDGQLSLEFYGNGQYSVLWSNQETSLLVSDLIAGTYQYTITDTSGCIFSDSITLTEPTPLSLSYTFTQPSCYEVNDGVSCSKFQEEHQIILQHGKELRLSHCKIFLPNYN